MQLPDEFQSRTAEPAVVKLMHGERTLLEARLSAREGQKSQLKKRILQLQDEITGLKAQQTAKAHEAALIVNELVGVRELYQKKLVPLTRLSTLEREAANIDGQRGQLIAGVAQAEGKIAETSLQIIQIDEEMRAEVMKEHREIQGKIAELVERRVAAEDQLKRVDIRSPSAGFVHQLTVHTVGGVISPAEPAMLIVPVNEALNLEAKVMPNDIDQIAIGQKATVRVHASNARTTPEINGSVTRISADVTKEEKTAYTYYTIRVVLPPEELRRLGGLHLIAGMQAEVYVQTHDRTPFQYLIKPLKDQIARTFRET
jgi:HlyD family secretion protein